jgi:hypothetical protein
MLKKIALTFALATALVGALPAFCRNGIRPSYRAMGRVHHKLLRPRFLLTA